MRGGADPEEVEVNGGAVGRNCGRKGLDDPAAEREIAAATAIGHVEYLREADGQSERLRGLGIGGAGEGGGAVLYELDDAVDVH